MLFLLITTNVSADTVEPNRELTPGSLNTNVSQENLNQTVCVPGFTTKIRPSSNYTNKLKIQQIHEYGYSDTNPKHYQEDHRIPLSVSGHPTDPHNLWPESLDNAKQKDVIEHAVHKLLCSGKITLKQAQHVFLNDWNVEYPKLLKSLK
jgi:hypothetical protein